MPEVLQPEENEQPKTQEKPRVQKFASLLTVMQRELISLGSRQTVEEILASAEGQVTSDTLDIAALNTSVDTDLKMAVNCDSKLQRVLRNISFLKRGLLPPCDASNCKKKIPAIRLEACPDAECCIDCQRKRDSRR